MKKPSISFFCPAYFDEKNLPILIPIVVEVLRKNASEFEIIIVEDGSPDNTKEVADMLAEKYKPYIKVVHHTKNTGYGGALKKGFNIAKKYEYVFFTDGDNQYDVREFSRLLPYIGAYDAVLGYRTKRALTMMRNIQTRVFNWIIRSLFSLRVKDINCSMKVISRKALNSISLDSDGSFIEAELLIKLQDKGYKIKEVEVTHYPRVFGKASGGDRKLIFKTISEMMQFYKHRNSRNI